MNVQKTRKYISHCLAACIAVVILLSCGNDNAKNADNTSKKEARTKSDKGLDRDLQRLRDYLCDDSVTKMTINRKSNSIFAFGNYKVDIYLKGLDRVDRFYTIEIDSKIDFLNALIYISFQVPGNIRVPLYENGKVIHEVVYLE